MATIRNFHEKLEQDLQRVTAEIERRRERAPEIASREVVRQSIIAAIPQAPVSERVEASPSGSSPAAPERIPAYLNEESPEIKAEVERLVSLAFEKGISSAVEEAAKKSPFVLDAFHDALADKLLPELEKRGII